MNPFPKDLSIPDCLIKRGKKELISTVYHLMSKDAKVPLKLLSGFGGEREMLCTLFPEAVIC